MTDNLIKMEIMKEYKNETTQELLGFYYDYDDKNFIYKFIQIKSNEIIFKEYNDYYSRNEYNKHENILIVNNTNTNKNIVSRIKDKLNEIYLKKNKLIESQYNILTDKNKTNFFQIENYYMNKDYYPYTTYEKFELKLFNKYKYKSHKGIIDLGILTDFNEIKESNGNIIENIINLRFYNKKSKNSKKEISYTGFYKIDSNGDNLIIVIYVDNKFIDDNKNKNNENKNNENQYIVNLILKKKEIYKTQYNRLNEEQKKLYQKNNRTKKFYKINKTQSSIIKQKNIKNIDELKKFIVEQVNNLVKQNKKTEQKSLLKYLSKISNLLREKIYSLKSYK